MTLNFLSNRGFISIASALNAYGIATTDSSLLITVHTIALICTMVGAVIFDAGAKL